MPISQYQEVWLQERDKAAKDAAYLTEVEQAFTIITEDLQHLLVLRKEAAAHSQKAAAKEIQTQEREDKSEDPAIVDEDDDENGTCRPPSDESGPVDKAAAVAAYADLKKVLIP